MEGMGKSEQIRDLGGRIDKTCYHLHVDFEGMGEVDDDNSLALA